MSGIVVVPSGPAEIGSAGLVLASDLVLPVEAVTETFVVLAKRGSGKTYTAAVLVEELVGAGLPVVVIDPVGVWWGLRSSADGHGDGLPVVIFGGDHADLPLDEKAGGLLADLVVEQRVSVVLDLSSLSKAGARRFLLGFAERLYHRNREPLHLVLDEADLFAPQQRRGADPESARLLGAVEDIVRRGRARGLGVTMITQRPAVLHKDVLTQAEVLIALRMTGVRDVAAIDEWVRLHADEAEARTVKASLPALPVGTAWVWSPGWLGVLARVAVRRRRTFDSSATPKVGQRLVVPERMAPVELAVLGERIAALAELADAQDPARLRDQVQSLRRQLAARPAAPARVVEVIPDGLARLLPRAADLLSTAAAELAGLAAALRSHLDGHQPSTPNETAPVVGASPAHPNSVGGQAAAACRRADESLAHAGAQLRALDDALDDAARVPRVAPAGLRAGARRMLEVLARYHPIRMSRAQLAALAGMAAGGGTFGTYFSALSRAGYLFETAGGVGATPAGRIAAGLPDAGEASPMTAQEVREIWRRALRGGARAMLDHLLQAYPRPVTRGQLAAAAGLEARGGTFGSYLSTLRRNGLVTVTGDQVRAADVFFLAAEHQVVGDGR